jgi:hypothetical protein
MPVCNACFNKSVENIGDLCAWCRMKKEDIEREQGRDEIRTDPTVSPGVMQAMEYFWRLLDERAGRHPAYTEVRRRQ